MVKAIFRNETNTDIAAITSAYPHGLTISRQGDELLCEGTAGALEALKTPITADGEDVIRLFWVRDIEDSDEP